MNVPAGWFERLLLFLYQQIQHITSKIKNWIGCNREIIPFSEFLLWYLNLPFIIRMFGFSFITLVSGYFYYLMGFIILQSRSRNELLSIASSYLGEIPFPTSLYLLYSFMYVTIAFVPVIVLLGIIFVINNIDSFKKKFSEKSIAKLLNRPLLFLILIISELILIYGLPYIPYYLLFSTKNSSLLDDLIQYKRGKGSSFSIQDFDYAEFRNELFFSVIGINLLLAFLIFILLYLKNKFNEIELNQCEKLKTIEMDINQFIYLKNNLKLWGTNLQYFIQKYIIGSTFKYLKNPIFSSLNTCVVFLFFGQVVFQLGILGKNLTKFDTDYVIIQSIDPAQALPLKGYRIYQDKEYIILRDLENETHFIRNENIHIKTNYLEIMPNEIMLSPGESYRLKVIFNGKIQVTNFVTYLADKKFVTADGKGLINISQFAKSGDTAVLKVKFNNRTGQCVIKIK